MSLGRAIRELDQFLADLDAAGLLDSPAWAPVVTDIRRHRRMAYEAIREAAPDEAYYWTPEWQEGEREVDAELQSGGGELFMDDDAFDAALRSRRAGV